MNRPQWSLFIAAVLLVLLPGARAVSQTESIKNRQKVTLTEHPVTITNLGSNVNSSDNDFGPVITGTGRVLFFTSDRDGSQDIFTSVSSATGWSAPASVGPMLNTDNQEGGLAVTADGHWMIFTGCDREDGFGDCDLFIAEYLGGIWRNVENLGQIVNGPRWDSQPTVSADGLMLVFASERDGGFGGTDLWLTTRTLGGKWNTPVNLGPNVNTDGDEMSPAIAADNKTLYFASNGLPGAGGFDIYTTKNTGSGWAAAQNLGAPVNTEYDDCFFSLQLGTDNIFFASDRSGGAGKLDLHMGVPNPLPPGAVRTVVGLVSDGKTKTPVGATLTVRDIRTNEIINSFRSDDVDGSYVVVLQPGKTYVITAEAPDYLFYSDRFDVPADVSNKPVRKDIFMTRDIVRLLVFFEFDKADLQEESYVDLDRAAQWMRDNPAVEVEIAGHTDSVGARDYNRHLSQDRANSVKEYLARKGVPSGRLIAIGYGMDQPTATNDTDEGRALNRRVEFRVRNK